MSVLRVLRLLACLVAGNFLVNGLLHLWMGLRRRRFVKRPRSVTQPQFEKVYAGPRFSSARFNTVFGLSQLALGLALAWVGAPRLGLPLETGVLLAGIALSTGFLAWKYAGVIA
jgi:hypothetical protein